MKLQRNINLKKYNTYAIGGNAKYFILAKEKQDLVDALKFTKEKNVLYRILGGGSNVLISDSDYDGLVIVNKVSKIERAGNGLKVSSGTAIAQLIKYMTDESLTGAEFLAGIPGTLGGAILGNAGAYGGEIGGMLDFVEFLDDSGIRQIDIKDIDFNENSHKQAKVKALEREIDQLVYKLYDLTPEEIEIVEGKE